MVRSSNSFDPSKCFVGAENHALIMNVKEDIRRIENKVDGGFLNIDNRITELFNHQSSKLPQWVVWFVTILSSLLTALVTYTVTH